MSYVMYFSGLLMYFYYWKEECLKCWFNAFDIHQEYKAVLLCLLVITQFKLWTNFCVSQLLSKKSSHLQDYGLNESILCTNLGHFTTLRPCLARVKYSQIWLIIVTRQWNTRLEQHDCLKTCRKLSICCKVREWWNLFEFFRNHYKQRKFI